MKIIEGPFLGSGTREGLLEEVAFRLRTEEWEEPSL